MPADKWPCVPNGFSSIFQGEVPFFLQTGAVHIIRRATSIIDPITGERIDPQNRFDKFQPFCECLRGNSLKKISGKGFNQACLRCDELVARYLVQNAKSVDHDQHPIRYRCYMGLEEMAYFIKVGGASFMIVAGQFLPPEGSNDVRAIISNLGLRGPKQSEISEKMWKSINDFGFSEDLWTVGQIAPVDRDLLLEHVRSLRPLSDDDEDKMRQVAHRITEIARSYCELTKARVESKIFQATAKAFSEVIVDHGTLWKTITNCLEKFRSGISVQYVAFLSGYREHDTLLNLRAHAGNLPESPSGSAIAHFNWRKAELKTEDERDTAETWRDWKAITLADRPIMMKGFKGHWNPFNNCSAILPIRLPNGPFGVVVLGPHVDDLDLSEHSDFLTLACHDVALRILTLQLSRILQIDRSDWEKTSKMTGHRVRAAIQSLGSQLRVIKAFHSDELDISPNELELAENDLNRSFKDLTEISYAAEASIPRAIDVKISKRETISLGNILIAALSSQKRIAEQFNIKIENDDLTTLGPVYANPTLLRYAFINIINNALKYSNPNPTNLIRIVYIRIPPQDPGILRVDISNFGLGIKKEEIDRIYEWGVRLSGQNPLFKGIYGQGVGLWESKHIIEGHGGKIFARSEHFTGVAVTNDNIKECITHFMVVLPQA
jgi:signal transduction histidine kinase